MFLVSRPRACISWALTLILWPRHRAVTVHGTVPFKGVLITARDVHTSEVLQGTFTADHQTKTLNCSGGQSNGLTHTSNVPKSQVITQWTAPAGYKGQVYFSVTVVQAFNTFWKDITSEAVFVQ